MGIGMNEFGQTAIGVKDGLIVYVSEDLLCQVGLRKIREHLGLIRRFPVQTDLSGNTVMVEADSHEMAVQKYLNRNTK